MNPESITKQLIDICQDTGNYIAAEKSKLQYQQIEEKGKHNFVTYVDKSAEEKLVKALKNILPASGILAEEGSFNEQSDELFWIIDPLDGTTNFIHGLPPFSISIALCRKDEIVAGIVHEINLQESFYAWKGSPAFLNGDIISVSKAKSINESLLATGFPYNDEHKLEDYLSLFNHLIRKSRGIRRLGSAAVDLAYVACGRFDGFYEYNLNPWDVAAGAFIVEQAGGKCSDFDGGKNFIYGKQLLSSNGQIHEEMLHTIQKYFGK